MTQAPATTPRVSVLIPAYNAAGCIRRSVGSVLAQTETDFEIIVVDDASTDATADIVGEMAETDSRIRLVRLPRNGGPSVARNAAIENARGRWSALLDADDAYKPERLETLCKLAEEHQLDAIADDLIYYDGTAAMEVKKGGFAGAKSFWPVSLDDYLGTTTYRVGLAEAIFREDKPISLLKTVMRTSFLHEQGIRYSEEHRYCEDFLIYFDILRRGGKMAVTGKAMYIYTEPLGSISRQSSAFSRTVANRQAVAQAVDAILESDKGLTARQVAMLRLRKKSSESAIRYSHFRQATQDSGKIGIVRRIIFQPDQLLRFVREQRHGLTSHLRNKRLYSQSSSRAREA